MFRGISLETVKGLMASRWSWTGRICLKVGKGLCTWGLGRGWGFESSKRDLTVTVNESLLFGMWYVWM